jgi:endonuclease YncB( thermonuclease family)
VASRKGIEPLTPGLGNLCSILLSYRDLAEPPSAVFDESAADGQSVSMDFWRAHRLVRGFAPLRAVWAAMLAATPALLAATVPSDAACGAPDGHVRVESVDNRLDLALADGRVVRLAGVAPPDTERSPALAADARRFLEVLFVGRDADLRRLATGTDRWGRVLADVTPQQPLAPAQPPAPPSPRAPPAPDQNKSAALALLAAGYARVNPAVEAQNCAAERLAAEDGARRKNLGVWADPLTAVVPASDAEALRRSGSRLVVIEGIVRRVGFGRSRLYLDLAPKGGPTIVVPRKLAPAFARAGVPVESATGWTIRVRGALDGRLGPRLEVSEPAMIEVLGRSSARGAAEPRP